MSDPARPSPAPADPWLAAQAAQRQARRKRLRASRATPRPPAAKAPRPPTAAQRAGRDAENLALRRLCRAGLVPLARNLCCRGGEIDLALRDGDILVFVEVRSRASGRYGGAAASVDAAKQARLARAAAYFLPRLAQAGWQGRTPPCRFDVVALDGAAITWIRDAFRLP